MKKVMVRVPLRADLAGGTLDLWPLYLFHPGSRTVNVAISFHAECEISRGSEDHIDVVLSDQAYERRYASIAEVLADPKAALIARALEHFKLTGIRVVTRSDAPRGSGLGGSSALAVALVRAMSEFSGNPVEGDSLIELVRDLETRLIKVPAGIQDYYPPVYGGLMSIHLNPGRVSRHPLSLPIAELGRHFLIHYSGVSHFSGTNNWEIYTRHIDGDAAVIDGLSRIAATSIELEHALETHNMKAAGKALQKEWENRKALIAGVSTSEIDQAVEAGRSAGAWGAKVCGAGGGGCIVFLVPIKKKEAVRAALASVPGETLNAVPVSYGLNIEIEDEPRSSVSTSSRREESQSGNYEQLYETGHGEHGYHPHVFVESRITYDEPRAGIHITFDTSLVAPADLHTERIEWERATELNAHDVQMSAVPDAQRPGPSLERPGALIAAAREGEDTVRGFLADRARLTLLHNPAFGLWSEPGESFDSFLKRCLDHARQHLEEEAERLESTFRRRMDQMREKSEREHRDSEKNLPQNEQGKPRDLNIAWGQALYNITSGKQATPESEPKTRNEADYIDRISQLQKQWEREREQKREELDASARSIQEVVLTPNARNIEIVRYLILWTGLVRSRQEDGSLVVM